MTLETKILMNINEKNQKDNQCERIW